MQGKIFLQEKGGLAEQGGCGKGVKGSETQGDGKRPHVVWRTQMQHTDDAL